MERLTKKSGEMVWLKSDGLFLEPCEARSNADIRDALVRLAAYEDTGLTPEDIVALAGEVNIWKSGYCDLLKIVQEGMSMLYETIRKIPGANKQESEG